MSYDADWYVNQVVIRFNEDKENGDIDDYIHTFIDNHVSNSSIEENITIINDFAGGIYEAQQGYIDNYGEFTFDSKENFYAKLAYYSLYEVIYPLVMDKWEQKATTWNFE